MKKILCLGDSNTFGFIPQSGLRYEENERWCGILRNYFKKFPEYNFEIIENGLNNRTLFCKNPSGIEFCGCEYLNKLLGDFYAEDFDIIILALGINDTQKIYNKTLDEIQNGLEKTLRLIKEKSPKTNIILISPSILTQDIKNSYFSTMFDEKSIEKSQKLAEIFKNSSKKFNSSFIDFNKIASVSESDGLHYSIESHKKIAKFVIKYLINLII